MLLAGAAVLTSSGVQAQGYEFQPWPARQPAPAFEITDLQGHAWRLADLRGKAVLINFWASWCAPCLAEMPSLHKVGELYGPDQVVVLAVNFKESEAVVRRYIQHTHLRLPVLLDPAGMAAKAWRVTVFPTTVLIAADGRVFGTVRGELDWSGAQAKTLLDPLVVPVGGRSKYLTQ